MIPAENHSFGRLMGLDLGTRRTGIALSDPAGELASAHSTVELPFKKLITHIAELVAAEDVALVVVGYPEQPSGTPSEIGRLAQRFKDGLRGRGIVCELWNEALTSWEAEQILQQSGDSPSRRRRKGDRGAVDRLAAALMLQDYIDHHRRSPRTQPDE